MELQEFLEASITRSRRQSYLSVTSYSAATSHRSGPWNRECTDYFLSFPTILDSCSTDYNQWITCCLFCLPIGYQSVRTWPENRANRKIQTEKLPLDSLVLYPPATVCATEIFPLVSFSLCSGRSLSHSVIRLVNISYVS